MSKKIAQILLEDGYHVEGLNVYNPRSVLLTVKPNMYGQASINLPNKYGRQRMLPVHLLVAGLKYGKDFFTLPHNAKHANGDKMDYSMDNIVVPPIDKAIAKAKAIKPQPKRIKALPKKWNPKTTGLLQDPDDLSNYF